MTQHEPDRAGLGWYAVRSIIGTAGPEGKQLYEERITIWEAPSFDDAIRMASAEARDYASDSGAVHDIKQAYALFGPPRHGEEVFSLMRDSDLKPDDYVRHYFATGDERQGLS